VSASSTTLETAVGAAVVALAVGFFAYAYKTAGVGGTSAAGGYVLVAEFDNAEGINVGTDVRLAGIKIGSVTAQTLNTESYQARIEMTVDKSVSLADDSAAKITSEGLLGGKFIALEPGGSDAKLEPGGQFSYTQGSVDLWALIGQAMSGSGNKGATPPSEPAPAPEPDAAPEAAPPATPPAAPAEQP
jgi:phospholipid/cholesterol/gamma-HCH transport system substrate-binding protein